MCLISLYYFIGFREFFLIKNNLSTINVHESWLQCWREKRKLWELKPNEEHRPAVRRKTNKCTKYLLTRFQPGPQIHCFWTDSVYSLLKILTCFTWCAFIFPFCYIHFSACFPFLKLYHDLFLWTSSKIFDCFKHDSVLIPKYTKLKKYSKIL